MKVNKQGKKFNNKLQLINVINLKKIIYMVIND